MISSSSKRLSEAIERTLYRKEGRVTLRNYGEFAAPVKSQNKAVAAPRYRAVKAALDPTGAHPGDVDSASQAVPTPATAPAAEDRTNRPAALERTDD